MSLNYIAIPIIIIGFLFGLIGIIRPEVKEDSNIFLRALHGRMGFCFGGEKGVYNGCLVFCIMMNIFGFLLLFRVIGAQDKDKDE